MTSRVEHIKNFPHLMYESCVDLGKTAVIFTASALHVLTLCKISVIEQYFKTFTQDDLVRMAETLSRLHKGIIKIINPNASFLEPKNECKKKCYFGITVIASLVLTRVVIDIADSKEDFFHQHIIRRCAFGIFAATVIPSAVIDVAFGALIASPISFITFGKIPAINAIAQAQLASFVAIILFFPCIRGVYRYCCVNRSLAT